MLLFLPKLYVLAKRFPPSKYISQYISKKNISFLICLIANLQFFFGREIHSHSIYTVTLIGTHLPPFSFHWHDLIRYSFASAIQVVCLCQRLSPLALRRQQDWAGGRRSVGRGQATSERGSAQHPGAGQVSEAVVGGVSRWVCGVHEAEGWPQHSGRTSRCESWASAVCPLPSRPCPHGGAPRDRPRTGAATELPRGKAAGTVPPGQWA